MLSRPHRALRSVRVVPDGGHLDHVPAAPRAARAAPRTRSCSRPGAGHLSRALQVGAAAAVAVVATGIGSLLASSPPPDQLTAPVPRSTRRSCSSRTSTPRRAFLGRLRRSRSAPGSGSTPARRTSQPERVRVARDPRRVARPERSSLPRRARPFDRHRPWPRRRSASRSRVARPGASSTSSGGSSSRAVSATCAACATRRRASPGASASGGSHALHRRGARRLRHRLRHRGSRLLRRRGGGAATGRPGRLAAVAPRCNDKLAPVRPGGATWSNRVPCGCTRHPSRSRSRPCARRSPRSEELSARIALPVSKILALARGRSLRLAVGSSRPATGSCMPGRTASIPRSRTTGTARSTNAPTRSPGAGQVTVTRL